MNPKRSILQAAFFLAAMAASLLLAGAARAQEVSARFVGKFTLTSPVHWGKSTLEPGTYSIRINSMAYPIVALISREDSTFSFAIRVATITTDDYRNGPNALHLEFRKGSLVVQSLSLADLKTALIYKASPAQDVEEARANTSIPIFAASK